jgi:predicted nucleic acid-binding protein
VISLYLIDTSVWIFALRRNAPEAMKRRLGGFLDLDIVATCGLVELELLGGTNSIAEYERLRSRLTGLHQLPIDAVDWASAARLASDLRRSGVTVPFTNALLAALAQRHGATLVHADRDFDLIARHTSVVVESLVDIVDS